MESGQYLWAAGQFFYSEDYSCRSFCSPVECQGDLRYQNELNLVPAIFLKFCG